MSDKEKIAHLYAESVRLQEQFPAEKLRSDDRGLILDRNNPLHREWYEDE
jgi:hypothetical protein